MRVRSKQGAQNSYLEMQKYPQILNLSKINLALEPRTTLSPSFPLRSSAKYLAQARHLDEILKNIVILKVGFYENLHKEYSMKQIPLEEKKQILTKIKRLIKILG